MTYPRVLLAEDDLPVKNFLTKSLLASGIDVVSTSNGQEAWDEFRKQIFSVVLTDLDMPYMRGEELIDKINESDSRIPPLIIVLTSLTDSEHIIEIMKKGVFDYLIKPAEASQIILKVKHALKSYDLQRMRFIMESEKDLRLKEELNWIKYKNEISNKNTDAFKDNIVRNMRHNLGQTGGFGNLMALLDLVQVEAKEDGDYFLINKDIFNLLKENVDIIDNTYSCLEEITRISESTLELTEVTVKDIYDYLREIVNGSNSILQIASNSLVLADFRETYSKYFVLFDKNSFQRIFEELLINACKFSEIGSKIFIIPRIQDRKLYISVVSEPKNNNEIVGVPLEYSNIVFEPFFRINKFVFEKFSSMDIGLGLTLVKELVKKLNGDVSITNIREFISVNSDAIKVNVEIELPLV